MRQLKLLMRELYPSRLSVSALSCLPVLLDLVYTMYGSYAFMRVLYFVEQHTRNLAVMFNE